MKNRIIHRPENVDGAEEPHRITEKNASAIQDGQNQAAGVRRSASYGLPDGVQRCSHNSEDRRIPNLTTTKKNNTSTNGRRDCTDGRGGSINRETMRPRGRGVNKPPDGKGVSLTGLDPAATVPKAMAT